jgi:hypothetical protein
VAIPEGSSSDAPVINPGPMARRYWRRRMRGFEVFESPLFTLGFFFCDLLTTQYCPSSRLFRGTGPRKRPSGLEVSRRTAQPSPRPTNQFATRNAPFVAVPVVGIFDEMSSWASPILSIPMRVRDIGSDETSIMSSTSSSDGLDYCNFHPRSSIRHRRRGNNRRSRCAN